METKLLKKIVILFASLGVIAIFCGSVIFGVSGDAFENGTTLKVANMIAAAGFVIVGICVGYGIFRINISYENLFVYYLSRVVLFPLSVDTVFFMTIAAAFDFIQPTWYIAEVGNMGDAIVGLVSGAPFWILFSILAAVMNAVVVFSEKPKFTRVSDSSNNM